MVSNDTFRKMFTGNAKPHDVSPKGLKADKPDLNASVLAMGKAIVVKPTPIKAARKASLKPKTAKGTKAA